MDDSALVPTATLSGEPPLEFEEFFLEHHEPLLRALWLVTRNRHEAEEIMQDSFLRLLERWSVVRVAENPEAYLYRTAMNVFRSRLRRAAVALRRAIGQLQPDDQFAEVEARDAVVRALSPLPARQRAAVVLVDVLGLTSEQAGEAMRVSPVTVRVLASRGRARLREAIDEDR